MVQLQHGDMERKVRKFMSGLELCNLTRDFVMAPRNPGMIEFAAHAGNLPVHFNEPTTNECQPNSFLANQVATV